MRILIMTMGSRGDVQPFIALGKGLQAVGHDIVFTTASTYQSFVEEHGLKYAPMTDELLRLTEDKKAKAVVESGGKNSLKLLGMVKPIIRQMFSDAWAAAQGVDALVYHPKTLAGYYIAEKLNIPAFLSLPLPLYSPTRAFPIPIFSQVKLGGGFNRMTYAMTRLVSAPYMGVVNEWRESQGMTRRGSFANDTIRRDGTPVPVLYSYSPHVVPVPNDWGAHVHATGYWFLDTASSYQPLADLLRFIEAGDPPVYVGFGSMVSVDPAAKARIVFDALNKAGVRGVLASGWGALRADSIPENVYMLDAVPHEWLFPRMSAVVHHGGAGTTAAGLRAGIPGVIVPFLGDQPFWGARLHELGVGAAPIPQKKLTSEALASAIRSVVTDSAMRQRAEAIGAAIRTEDGVGNAVAVINRYLQQ